MRFAWEVCVEQKIHGSYGKPNQKRKSLVRYSIILRHLATSVRCTLRIVNVYWFDRCRHPVACMVIMRPVITIIMTFNQRCWKLYMCDGKYFHQIWSLYSLPFWTYGPEQNRQTDRQTEGRNRSVINTTPKMDARTKWTCAICTLKVATFTLFGVLELRQVRLC